MGRTQGQKEQIIYYFENIKIMKHWSTLLIIYIQDYGNEKMKQLILMMYIKFANFLH